MPLMRGLNPSEPDRQFLVVTNNEGATINKDATVQADVTTDADGVNVVDMNTGELFAFVGVADAAITVGVGILLIDSLITEREERKVQPPQ